MIINNAEYVQAYTEVNCLLKYMPFSYINRLPEKLLTLIENQSDDFYYIEIDPGKGLTEQGLSKKAKDILAVLKYNYWSTEFEKKQLLTTCIMKGTSITISSIWKFLFITKTLNICFIAENIK